MTRLTVNIYYLLFIYLLLLRNKLLTTFDFKSHDINWFNLTSGGYHMSPTTAWSIYYTLLLLSLAVLFFKHRFLRLLVFILSFVFFSIIYSFGKINHTYHIWLISSFFMSFIDLRKDLHHSKNLQIIRLTQVTLLSHYFFSGLWKVREIKNFFSLETYTHTILEYIAFAMAEGNYPKKPFIEYLITSYPNILGLSFVIVIMTQLGCVIPILINRYYLAVGTLTIFFHLINGYVLGIGFMVTVYGLVYFFIFLELMLKRQKTLISTTVIE